MTRCRKYTRALILRMCASRGYTESLCVSRVPSVLPSLQPDSASLWLTPQQGWHRVSWRIRGQGPKHRVQQHVARCRLHKKSRNMRGPWSQVHSFQFVSNLYIRWRQSQGLWAGLDHRSILFECWGCSGSERKCRGRLWGVTGQRLRCCPLGSWQGQGTYGRVRHRVYQSRCRIPWPLLRCDKPEQLLSVPWRGAVLRRLQHVPDRWLLQ